MFDHWFFSAAWICLCLQGTLGCLGLLIGYQHGCEQLSIWGNTPEERRRWRPLVGWWGHKVKGPYRSRSL